jgi:hypothetical protein
VIRRGRLVALLLLGIAAAAAAPGASAPPRVGSTFYLVQADPRLCPSPACGGYWVQLVNHPRTRCSDGVLRPRCYVARAVDEERHPLESAVPHGAVVRAAIEPWRFEGLGEFGVAVVARTFAPAGRASPTGRYFRLVDTGIRCVRAPCFSMRASLLNHSSRTAISGLVLTTLGQRTELEERVLAELATRNGVLARGRIVRSPIGGREFHASRFYLASTC